MRKVLFLLLVLGSSFSKSWAHEFYFAYAELAYNEMNQKFEGTLIFTTHDLERALEPKGSLIGKLEKSDERSTLRTQLESYINQHFYIRYGCALDSNAYDVMCYTQFTLEGISPALNGTLECYISAPAKLIYLPTHLGLAYSTFLEIHFGALFETFSGQQNKLTLIYRNQKETLNFILENLITWILDVIRSIGQMSP